MQTTPFCNPFGKYESDDAGAIRRARVWPRCVFLRHADFISGRVLKISARALCIYLAPARLGAGVERKIYYACVYRTSIRDPLF